MDTLVGLPLASAEAEEKRLARRLEGMIFYIEPRKHRKKKIFLPNRGHVGA
jgi:hypothetical protein